MAKYLYFEGACGISGDMVVASLLDMGGNKEKLLKALESLKVGGFHCHIEPKHSYSIAGTDFDVHLEAPEVCHEEAYLAHEHPHPHPHPHEHGHKAAHSHPHPHKHGKAHDHHPHPHHHPEPHHGHHPHQHHEHRHLRDVYEIIDRAEITDGARALAKKIFRIVAEAEAKAHGVPLELVHFHEVGALDSIADIVAAAVLIDDLGVEGCVITGLSEGQGTVMCQHGELPVPVPAVMNIAAAHGIILRPTAVRGEMVTPTGIAIAAALKTTETLPFSYKILKTGIGLGKRDFGKANFLRTMVIEDVEPETGMFVLETNIDDCTSEQLGLALEKVFEAGAYDAHFEPCFMKKNRPAYMLRAIVAAQKTEAVEEAIFYYTTTIGIRRYPVERTCMERRNETVSLPEGEIAVKVSTYKNIVRCQPEFESVRMVAEKSGRDFKHLFDKARLKAEELFGES